MRRDVDDWDLMQALRLDSGIGPARPIDDATAAAIVGGAIERAFGGGGGGGGAGGAGGAARGGGFGAKALAGLAAATAVAVTAWFLLRPDERIDRAASVPMPVAIIEADAAPVAVPEAAAVPEPVAAPEPGPALAPRRRAEKPEREKPEKPTKPETPEKPQKKERRTVEDLMAEANAARKHKEWQRADALYLEVVKDHAQSPSAQVALVASATLHLEHLGDARGAMKRFRAAIGRVSGPLAEEARYGLAEAYRELGDRAAEAKALDDFLDNHGDSPLADRARERRGELP